MSPPKEDRRPGESGDQRDDLGDGVTDSIRRRLVVAVELLGNQAEREKLIFEHAWRAGFVAGFEDGVDVGRRQVLDEIAAAQAETYDRLRGVLSTSFQELEQIRFSDPHLTADRRCVEQGCTAMVHRVHYRVRFDVVRCHAHRPQEWCPEHRERDGCAYGRYMHSARRPEYQGGPVEWGTAA